MELRDYWRTIRRRWPVVALVVLICTGAAAFVTWQTTPLYSSTARLFVATSQADESTAYTNNLFASQRVTSYADIVPKSRRLADQVVENLGGDADPDTISSQITAVVVPETSNLELTAIDPDPVRARDIAQAYAEALSDLVPTLEPSTGTAEPLIQAQIFDNAQVPTSPVSPQPMRNIGLGLVIGLLLGIGLAVLRELLDTSVSTSEDVALVTDAPVLGHITADSQAAKKPPSETLSGTTHWAESFRVLRTNMQYVEVDNDQKVFVVTSPLPGEGKSTTAVNLAVTLAMTHQRVVLVECDLRRPLIGKRLALDNAVGTTSVLIGKVTLREAMQTHPDSGLRVLTSGPIPPNPSELLQSKAMEVMLAQLRAEFDIVLIDAPPLLPVTDAALLSAQADGALMVLRHGKTTQDHLTHALARLDAVDAKAVGIVFNMVPTKRAGSTYSYTYAYEYKSNELKAKSSATAKEDRSGRPGEGGLHRDGSKPRVRTHD